MAAKDLGFFLGKSWINYWQNQAEALSRKLYYSHNTCHIYLGRTHLILFRWKMKTSGVNYNRFAIKTKIIDVKGILSTIIFLRKITSIFTLIYCLNSSDISKG